MHTRGTLLRRGLGVGAWLLAAGGGLAALTAYAGIPGARREAPAADAGAPGDGRSRLYVSIHPRCPCSSASLAELERVMARAGGRLAVDILYFTPPGASDAEAAAFADTRILAAAHALEGARLRADPGAEDALALGALTSGHAVLYDAAGRLRFSGGLTAARGHEEPSAAREAILAVVRGDAARATEAPVFGCPLTREEE